MTLIFIVPFKAKVSNESSINGKAIAVIGAMDNGFEANVADALVTSGQI